MLNPNAKLGMKFVISSGIHRQVKKIVQRLHFPHIKYKQIICFRSYGSTSRAQARIWSLPRIWQKALQVEPHYCIEVISEKFDKLSSRDQTKTLIHELLHIPKTFSGALLPHRGRGGRAINAKTVNYLYRKFNRAAGDK